jgi:hypothetical protein
MTTGEDGEVLRDKIARAVCQARCVGNQKPDDPMGVLHTATGTEATPPYRWQTHLREADAVLALIGPVMGENERLRGTLENIVNHESTVSDDHTECENCRDAFFDDYFEVRALARAALSQKSEKQE